MNVWKIHAVLMQFVQIHRVVLYAHANQITQEIRTKVAQTLTNAQRWSNHVHRVQFVKMQAPATIANVHRAMQPNQIRKSLVNKSMWIYYVKVTSTAQQTLNVSKDNVSVKMDSNRKVQFALISMNVERMPISAVNDRFVLIHLDRIDVNARSK